MWITRYYVLSVLFICVFLFSCKKKIYNNEARETVVVSPIGLIGEQILKSDTAGIAITNYDSLILLRETKIPNVVHVYHNETFEFLGSIGTRGNGPNEWLAPRIMDQFFKKDSSIMLWMYEARRSQLRLINISQSLVTDNIVVEESHSIHPSHGLTQYVLYVSDNKIIGDMGFETYERNRLKLYDINSKEVVNKVDLFPFVKNLRRLNSSQSYQLYFDYIRKQPNGDRVVSAMAKFDRIDIFDENLELLKSITPLEQRDEELDVNKFDEEGMPNYFYNDLYVTNKYIFALWYNQPHQEFGQISIKPQIRVFDWDGNSIVSFLVPDYLASFSVDIERGWFYGLDVENEKILRYKFNPLQDLQNE